MDFSNIYAAGWRIGNIRSNLLSMLLGRAPEVFAYFHNRRNYSVDWQERKFHYANPSTGVAFTILYHGNELIVWFPLLRSEPFVDEALIEVQHAIPHFNLKPADADELIDFPRMISKWKALVGETEELKRLEQFASEWKPGSSDGLAEAKEEWIYKNRFRIQIMLCEDPNAIDSYCILPSEEIKKIWQRNYYGKTGGNDEPSTALTVPFDHVLAAEDVEYARRYAQKRVGKTILAPPRNDSWE